MVISLTPTLATTLPLKKEKSLALSASYAIRRMLLRYKKTPAFLEKKLAKAVYIEVSVKVEASKVTGRRVSTSGMPKKSSVFHTDTMRF